jgi:glycine cleavage system H protein
VGTSGPDGQITIGLDDFARAAIGSRYAIELPPVGAHLTAGRPALVVRRAERRLRRAAPTSGVVTEVNEALEANPVRLPWWLYSDGWILKIAPGARLSAELSGLAIGRDAKRWLRAELDGLRGLFERGLLVAPVEGALQRAGKHAWVMFERDVLRIEGSSSKRPS